MPKLDVKTYSVKSPIMYGKKRYEVGEPVEMDAKTGDPLLEQGVLGEPIEAGSDLGKAELLQLACGSLDTENKDHFTDSGLPQTKVLSDFIKAPVSAAERDAAWEEFNKGE